MAFWPRLNISRREPLGQTWRNLSFQSKLAILLVTVAAVPLVLMTEGMVILFHRALSAKINEGLQKDLRVLNDEIAQHQDFALSQADNLAEQVQVAKINLGNPQAVQTQRSLLNKVVNSPKNRGDDALQNSFAILLDPQGQSVAQNIQTLAEPGATDSAIPASEAARQAPQFRPVDQGPGISLKDVSIVQASLKTQRPLTGTELLSREVLERLGLASQAAIGIRPQRLKGLSQTQQPFPQNTFDTDRGRTGLVLMAVQPIRVNNQWVGVAVVGTLLNRNYDLVDRMQQRYGVQTVSLFAQDLAVSTNVPYVNPATGRPDQSRAIGTRAAREVVNIVLQQNKFFIGRANIIGENYFTAYCPLYDHRQQLNPDQAQPIGMLSVGEPAQVIEDFLAWKRLLGYGLGGSILLVVGLVSVPVARSFSSPLRHLARFAQRIATGKPRLDIDLGDRRDEIGVLSRELHHMTVTLESNLAAAQQQIEERQRAEAALRLAEEKYRSIFENATEGIFQTSPEGSYISANPALARIYGYESREALIGSLTDIMRQLYVAPQRRDQFVALIHHQGFVSEFESQIYRKDGSIIWISENARAVSDRQGRLLYYEGTVEDISERKRFEAQLAFFANHDPLTGLLNRRFFQEELERLLSSGQESYPGAVLFLDLDDFKDINDTLGHLAGDDLLKQLATLLRSQLRQVDILARLGGDEFAILLPQSRPRQVRAVAKRILEALSQPVTLANGQPTQISASLGISLFPDHSRVGEELLAHADTAMYRAKQQGRNQFCFYLPDANWQKRIRSRQSIKARIHQALEKDLLVLHCQPILDLHHQKITRYELLLRLGPESSPLIAPNAFLPIAERYGLIHDIDRWVVRQAIQLIAQHQQWSHFLTLEVNISGKSLADPELLPLIQQELARTGIHPHQLVFEITETAAIADLTQACRFMESLKELGCQFALDDFGIGYSSFFQLKSLPVDYLKIDGSFIRNLPQDQVDRQLVQAIVDVSRSLGKRTIAEFVGSQATTYLLLEMGVDYAQGYHIGQPRPVSEMLAGQLQT